MKELTLNNDIVMVIVDDQVLNLGPLRSTVFLSSEIRTHEGEVRRIKKTNGQSDEFGVVKDQVKNATMEFPSRPCQSFSLFIFRDEDFETLFVFKIGIVVPLECHARSRSRCSCKVPP